MYRGGSLYLQSHAIYVSVYCVVCSLVCGITRPWLFYSLHCIQQHKIFPIFYAHIFILFAQLI